MSDLILASAASLFVLCIVILAINLYEKSIVSKLVARKIIHIFAGFPFYFISRFSSIYSVLAIVFVIMFFIRTTSKNSKMNLQKRLYNAIVEPLEEEVGYLQGPFHFLLSVFLVLVSFIIIPRGLWIIGIVSISIMIFSDTFAAIIGKKYGKINIAPRYTRTRRTIIGSISFFLISLVLSYSMLVFGGIGTSVPYTVLSFILALISTSVELFSPGKYDDLTIPIFTTIIGVFLIL